MEIAARLRSEARSVDERRVLVLAGGPETTRERASDALDAAAIPRTEMTLLGPEQFLDCEHHPSVRADALLGRTETAVVYDAHERASPNALGQAVGAVDGGGLFVLLAPPLSEWPDRRDAFDDTLAVPPFERSDVAGRFRSRLVSLVESHRGVAVVDADTGTVERSGLTDPPPRRAVARPTPPSDSRFPTRAYESCLTGDQASVLADLERLAESGTATVVEADRGRGKSAVAGLAAGSLAADGEDVLVTAPAYSRAREVFVRAETLLADLDALAGVDSEDDPWTLEAESGRVRFAGPVEAVDLPGGPDAVVVDEAAALPVRLLDRFLDAEAVAFTTTVHGYEGAGRGFSVRFRDHLEASDCDVLETTMAEPIRYAAGDPVEVWLTRALLLDARPAVDPVVDDATPESASYERLTPAALCGDEHLLREVFGLLVLAHYRTEPDDLARLLDAPNVSVRALTHEGHVVSVALLAREGGLPPGTRASMYEGSRIRGNMIPDVLSTQLRDEAAGEPVGWRVMRIATHPAVRERGLGSALLSNVEREARERGAVDPDGEARPLDWLGVGYGATPELLSFWRESGYRTVHVSTTRNERSGEHSAIMLRPLSAAGRDLRERHTDWFHRRLTGMLSTPLSDLDPAVVLAVLGSLASPTPLSLTDREWRLVAGSPFGAGLFEVSPEPFRRLALRGLADDDGPAIPERSRRVLVRACLQGDEWETVADSEGFHSRRECLRAFGDAVETLVDAYGPAVAQAELDRFR
jgi:tRNA(Met) cytidine acetyltransferase